ncbi:MAG TPA: hypothetical protein VHK06_06700, partial [Candidatus Limnocylindria bacterium]|nr:hypothetical protein [Candidatus Limnocylindria bacterium]
GRVDDHPDAPLLGLEDVRRAGGDLVAGLGRRRGGRGVREGAERALACPAVPGAAAFGALPNAAAPAAAAEPGYEIATRATYVLEPEERRIRVVVDATFTNRTPNPAGGFSVFESVPLAVHDAAAEVSARDDRGPLSVSLRRQGSGSQAVNVATVRLRSAIRYERSARFRLQYLLPDGGETGLRVRPSAVRFTAWGFGTRSDVAVRLPAGYSPRSDGDPLTVAVADGTTELRSGPVTAPEGWAAVVVATPRDAQYTTLTESVPLSGATVEVRVRAWQDDEEWGRAMLALAARALPLLEERFGRYPDSGPLVISEVAPTRSVGFGEEEGGAPGDVRVAFDQPPFTLLHQLAHRWATPELAADRWIREGLASHAAGEVAAALELDRPYDPAARMDELGEARFALSAWPPNATPQQEAYGHAAAWQVMDRLAAEIGDEALVTALARAAAAVPAYDPVTEGDALLTAGEPPATTPTPLDSRTLLDQLETIAGQDVSAVYAPVVFDEEDSQLLADRADARADYGRLLEAAGEWGTPRPVRRALEAWQFDAADRAIRQATEWLRRRDALLARIEDAGLSAPERLRVSWEQDGGSNASRVELEAVERVVSAYREASRRASAPPSALERIGMLGGADPSDLLRRAAGLFAEGDLSGGMDAVGEATAVMDSAETAGWVRIASALVLVAAAAAAVIAVYRRRRYTAAR